MWVNFDLDPNYHNKHLRNEALQRITNEVQKVRPNTQIKDCMNKIHSLRNGFNTENKKRKESMKSGSGTNDIYISNLWYFELLTFLEEHFVPRKSTSTKIDGNNNKKNATSNLSSMDNTFQGTNKKINIDETFEDFTILINTDENPQNENFEQEEYNKFEYPPNICNGLSGVEISNLENISCNNAITTSTLPNEFTEVTLCNSLTSSPSSSQPLSSLCSSTSSMSSSKRRRIATKKDISDNTVKKIIDCLNKPIVLPSLKEKNSIDLGLEFVASVIKKIKDEKNRINCYQISLRW